MILKADVQVVKLVNPNKCILKTLLVIFLRNMGHRPDHSDHGCILEFGHLSNPDDEFENHHWILEGK